MIQNTSAHSKNQVSAYFTSMYILSIGRALTSKKEAVTPDKRENIFDLQVSKYGRLTALEETGTPVKNRKCLIHQGADNAF